MSALRGAAHARDRCGGDDVTAATGRDHRHSGRPVPGAAGACDREGDDLCRLSARRYCATLRLRLQKTTYEGTWLTAAKERSLAAILPRRPSELTLQQRRREVVSILSAGVVRASGCAERSFPFSENSPCCPADDEAECARGEPRAPARGRRTAAAHAMAGALDR